MSIAQAQQAQIDQATKAAQEAQAHAARLANQAQSASEGKKDTFKELEKLGKTLEFLWSYCMEPNSLKLGRTVLSLLYAATTLAIILTTN